MSEVLARLRVRETHGIRRFLYPIKVELTISLQIAVRQRKQLSLINAEGQPVPYEKGPVNLKQVMASVGQLATVHPWFFYFPVFLAPFEEAEFRLTLDELVADLDDPLQLYIPDEGVVLSSTPNSAVRSVQRRVTLSLTPNGQVSEVVYDGIPHLRGQTTTSENDNAQTTDETWDFGLHAAWTQQKIVSPEVTTVTKRAEITAYKSWVMLTHTIEQPKANDEIVFTLPLAITSPTLTCDFGVGGYVFGKLDSKATEIVWRTEFGDAPYAKWTIATAGRVDYVGEVGSAEAFLPQRWFHLIDSDKALAVAITKLPAGCQSLTVRLTVEGDVSIAFTLGDAVTGHAEFGVCYHFLNDVPAIAAATNPQSILLPPTVEVLPV